MILKAVLFDLDGTLLDSVPVILKSARQVFFDMELPYNENTVRRAIGIPLKVQASQWAGTRALEFEDRYRAAYRINQHSDFQLFPGTIEMLDHVHLAGLSTALVTSKSTRGAMSAIEKTALAGHFDVVISADDVTHPKPEPEPILKALDMLGVGVKDAVYVGDSTFDIDCAQRAGVQMAAVSWGARTREDLLLMCPNSVFDTWPEFVSWLK